MKVKALRPFWLGEHDVKVGEIVDVKPALAAEMIHSGKAESAPEDPPARKAAKPEAEPKT
jgi:hypothetical protein